MYAFVHCHIKLAIKIVKKTAKNTLKKISATAIHQLWKYGLQVH